MNQLRKATNMRVSKGVGSKINTFESVARQIM